MFGIGLTELAVIAFFGVVLFGPDKLPQLASQAAKAVRAAKAMADTVRDDLRENLGEDYTDLELRDLHPRELVRRQLRGVLDAEDADTADDDEDEDDETPEAIDHDSVQRLSQNGPADTPRPDTFDEGKSA